MAEDRSITGVTIRPFAGMAEYEACTAFQEETWGKGFNERVPAAILMVANRIGGLAAGAFDEEGTLLGFVFGITGVEGGEPLHWSDMLAVRRGWRDRGLGTRLKHYQREYLLDRGVRRMRWTFDPLQSRNACVNFRKLGIVTGEYVRDMYGDTGSPLHQGIGTDRLVAFWEMDSPRVVARIEGRGPRPDGGSIRELPAAVPVSLREEHPVPGGPVLNLEGTPVTVSVPGNVDAIVEADLPLAIRWREVTREAFIHYFRKGYEARELLPGGPVSHYVLFPRE